MRVAFYAPLKAPTHPVPSGDRLLARLFMRALAAGGHEVALASTLRTWDGTGDARRQRRLAALGARLAERLARHARRKGALAPECWFTYHLYHKAPDWIGPAVSAELGIPYVVAEASHAAKQAGGPWALGHDATRSALGAARAVVVLKRRDLPGVRPLLARGAELVCLRPFLDLGPFAAADGRAAARAELAPCLDLDPELPWLVAVAMMRPGDKTASFRVLGAALGRLADAGWSLIVVGDGPARAEVEGVLTAACGGRVRFAGRWTRSALARRLPAFDLFVWPAVNEAIGMAVLEAQAAGVAAVVGRSGGLAQVVRDGRTGRLVEPRDPDALARAIGELLAAPDRRSALGREARAVAFAEHDLGGAARVLDGVLRRAAGGA